MRIREARELLTDAHVDLAPPATVVGITGARLFQHMLKEVEIRREAIRQYRTLKTANRGAVRYARARLTVYREPRAVLTEPVGGVVKHAGKTVLDVVVRSRQHLFFGIVKGAVGVVRKRHRRCHRIHVFGVRPGITQANVPTIVEGLEQAEGKRFRLVALGTVGQHKSGQAR